MREVVLLCAPEYAAGGKLSALTLFLHEYAHLWIKLCPIIYG